MGYAVLDSKLLQFIEAKRKLKKITDCP